MKTDMTISTVILKSGLPRVWRTWRAKTLAGGILLAFATLPVVADIPIHEFETLADVGTTQCGTPVINDDTSNPSIRYLSATSAGNDPQVYINNLYTSKGIALDLGVYKKVVIRMKVASNVGSNPVLYWGTSDANGYSSNRSVTLNWPSGTKGTWQELTVDMSSYVSSGWSGFLDDIRIDPMGGSSDSGKSFQIDYIRLNSDASDVTSLYPVFLSMLWRVDVGGWDFMSTGNKTELDNFISYGSYGQVFYLPKSSATDRTALYRFRKSTTPVDHRDSTSTSVSGYTQEGAIGYPWNTQITGTQPVLSYYSTTMPVDYATVNPWDVTPSLTDYQPDSVQPGVYGYSRYGATTDQTPGDLLSISGAGASGGNVTFSSSRVAGGSVYSLTWDKNNTPTNPSDDIEFLNANDEGREIQSAFYFMDNTGQSSDGKANPTEAGARRDGMSNALWERGELRPTSPLVQAYNIGGSQITQCVPLEWNPNRYGGNTYDPCEPVIFPGIRLGKEITPNFNGMGVTKYVTVLHVPSSINSYTMSQIEMPACYLRGNFTNFYTYDAGSTPPKLTSVSLNVFPTTGYNAAFFPSGYGGVIIADGNGNNANALGAYGVTVNQGGSVSYFGLMNFAWPGNTGHYDPPTTKWTVVRSTGFGGAFSTGDNRFTCYIIAGTLSDVTTKMNALYSAGVK